MKYNVTALSVRLRETPNANAPDICPVIQDDVVEKVDGDSVEGWIKVKAVGKSPPNVGFIQRDDVEEQPADTTIDPDRFIVSVSQNARRAASNPFYLYALAFAESGISNMPSSVAGSTAVGPFQYTTQRWSEETKKYGAANRIEEEDRSEPFKQATVAALSSGDAIRSLKALLGRDAQANELHLVHILGDAAGSAVLTVGKDHPETAIDGAMQPPLSAAAAAELLAGHPALLQKDNKPATIAEALNAAAAALQPGLDKTADLKDRLSPPDDTAPSAGGSSFADKCRTFMPKLMAAFDPPLKDFQAAGVFGNLGRESGGFRYYHELGKPENEGGYGWAQWTGDRRKAFFSWCDSQTPPLNRESDEASFGFLCHELNGTQSNALTALKGTKNVTEATDSFATIFEVANSDKAGMDVRHDWAQKALAALANPPAEPSGAGQPLQAGTASGNYYIARDPQSFKGQRVGDGECVTYVHEACKPDTLPPTHQWRKGPVAKGGDLPSGTIIATFRGADGGYNAADGLQHAAVFLEEKQDGLLVLDQFNAHGGQPGQLVNERTLRFGASSPVNDGDQFSAIKKV